jgi:hypothetical protein
LSCSVGDYFDVNTGACQPCFRGCSTTLSGVTNSSTVIQLYSCLDFCTNYLYAAVSNNNGTLTCSCTNTLPTFDGVCNNRCTSTFPTPTCGNTNGTDNSVYSMNIQCMLGG